MTCDNANGGLDYLANNNNVVNGAVHKEPLNSNGVKATEAVESSALEEEIETRKSLIVLLVIFATSIAAMIYIYKRFPELEE